MDTNTTSRRLSADTHNTVSCRHGSQHRHYLRTCLKCTFAHKCTAQTSAKSNLCGSQVDYLPSGHLLMFASCCCCLLDDEGINLHSSGFLKLKLALLCKTPGRVFTLTRFSTLNLPGSARLIAVQPVFFFFGRSLLQEKKKTWNRAKKDNLNMKP